MKYWDSGTGLDHQKVSSTFFQTQKGEETKQMVGSRTVRKYDLNHTEDAAYAYDSFFMLKINKDA